MSEEQRSIFEHKHDDWRGFDGTAEPGAGWVDGDAAALDNPGDVIARRMCLINPDSHLHRSVASNVAVRFPGYDVQHVYYYYYPDMFEQGVHHFAGVWVSLSIHGAKDMEDEEWLETLGEVEYTVSITELSGSVPISAIAADGHIKEEFAERLSAVVNCPECIYYRMLCEGMLKYNDGRERTHADLFAQEAEEEEEALS